MSWLQCFLKTSPEKVDSLEDTLLELGALAITLQDAKDQPVFEPALGTTPLWEQMTLLALFPKETPIAPLKSQLESRLDEACFKTLQFEVLPEQAWERTCLEHVKPMRFGQRLWIVPSWEETPIDDGIIVRLDPGLAFGTGTHPTTALCLKWLDEHLSAPGHVMDYGCGSGILGIAALKLGASQLTAVDIDPQALLSTKDNIEKNALAAEQWASYLPSELPKETQVDLVIANILSGPLTQLAPELAQHLKPGGELLLSGILENQLDEILACYKTWFEDFEVQVQEGWVRVYAKKQH